MDTQNIKDLNIKSLRKYIHDKYYNSDEFIIDSELLFNIFNEYDLFFNRKISDHIELKKLNFEFILDDTQGFQNLSSLVIEKDKNSFSFCFYLKMINSIFNGKFDDDLENLSFLTSNSFDKCYLLQLLTEHEILHLLRFLTVDKQFNDHDFIFKNMADIIFETIFYEHNFGFYSLPVFDMNFLNRLKDQEVRTMLTTANIVTRKCQNHSNITVVLDSELKYGSKIRGMQFFEDIKNEGYKEIVLAGSAEGYAQVSGPFCCNQFGLKCTIFINKNERDSLATQEARRLKANIIEIDYREGSRMRNLNVLAREYALKNPMDIKYIEIGLHDNNYIQRLSENMSLIRDKYKLNPSELWIVAGTGTIAAALSRSFVGIPINVVKVGLNIWDESKGYMRKTSFGQYTEFTSQLRFKETYRKNDPRKSPYKAHPNYDDKVWFFANLKAKVNALIWIVA